MFKSGETDQTIMHCIFVGPAGVGKSTLLKRLLRMKLDQTHTSTPLAEKSVRVDFIRQMSTTVAWASGFDWKIIEDPMTQASPLIVQLSAESEKISTLGNHSTEEAEQVSKPQKNLPYIPPEKLDDSENHCHLQKHLILAKTSPHIQKYLAIPRQPTHLQKHPI